MTDARLDEIAGNLTRVRSRIADACAAAGRDPLDVTLVVVSKTYPAADVVRLTRLGVRDIGENRDQEAAPKAAEVAAAGVDVRWHFVGQLQRNKARSVARYADVVHSVDSTRLAVALDAAARDRHRPLDVLVQVSLDDDPARGGASRETVAAVAEAVSATGALRLAGVMAIPPLDVEPGTAYERLARIAADLRREYPHATAISAGMSADLEPAIAYGATHVRIGSAVLGNRAPLG